MKGWKYYSKVMLSIVFVLSLCMLQVSDTTVFANEFEIIDDNDSRFSYSSGSDTTGGWGSWAQTDNDPAVSEHWTCSVGGHVTLSFEGDVLELYGKKAPNHYMLSVSIDGGDSYIVDAYDAQVIPSTLLFEINGLGEGEHSATITMLDAKNANYSDISGKIGGIQLTHAKVIAETQVEEDIEVEDSYTIEHGKEMILPIVYTMDISQAQFESDDTNIASVERGVIQANGIGSTSINVSFPSATYTFEIDVVAPLQESEDPFYSTLDVNATQTQIGSEYFTFHGNWGSDQGISELHNSDGNWSYDGSWGGSVNARNHYYSFTFTGSKFEIYSNLEPGLGVQEVYIDNIFYAYIDQYTEGVKKYQQLTYESPVLAEGEHEVRVITTGDKNPQASGASAYIDYIKVTKRFDKVWAESIEISDEQTMVEQFSTFKPNVDFIPLDTNQKNVNYVVDEDYFEILENGTLKAKQVGASEIVAEVEIADGTKIQSQPMQVTIIEGSQYVKVDFTSTNDTYLQEDYDVLANQTKKEQTITTWRNDDANVSFVILSKEEDIQASVSSSDFVSNTGAVLDASNIQPQFQQYVSTYTGGNWINWNDPNREVLPVGNRKLYPDIIQGTTLDIMANSVQPVWVKIHVPQNTPAGVYEGELIVQLDNGEEITLKQSIEVLNIELKEASESGADPYYFDLWLYPHSSARYYDVEVFSSQHFDILKNHYKEYTDAGGVTGTASIVEEPWNHQTYDDYPSMVKWTLENDTLSFDYTDFDKWVAFQLEELDLELISCFSMVPWGNQISYYENGILKEESLTPGSDKWISYWGQFIENFTVHLEQKGWYDHIMIAMDERSQWEMEAVLDLIESYPNSEGNTFKVSGAFNHYYENVWERMHQVTPHLGFVNGNFEFYQQVSEERREAGKITSVYTMIHDYPGMFTMSNPSEAAWTIWMAERYGVDGFLRWAYDAWVQAPLDEIAHWYFEAGDTAMIYPGVQEDGVVVSPSTSPRFERMEEAIKDIEKIRQLETMGEDVAIQAQAIVDSTQNYWGQASNNGIGSSGFRGPASTSIEEGLNDTVDRLKVDLMELSRSVCAQDSDARESLILTIEDANTIEVSLYTPSSVQQLDACIQDAYALLQNVDATTQSITDMNQSLLQAMQSMVYLAADYSKLNATLSTYETWLQDMEVKADYYIGYEDAKIAIQSIIDSIDYTLDITRQEDIEHIQTQLVEMMDTVQGKPIKEDVFASVATITSKEDIVSFTVKQESVSNFIGVYINDVYLPSDAYSVVDGSIIITLHPQHITTLIDGAYTIDIISNHSVHKATFNVAFAPTPSPEGVLPSIPSEVTTTSPNTSDTSTLGLWMLMMMLSACVYTYVRKQR